MMQYLNNIFNEFSFCEDVKVAVKTKQQLGEGYSCKVAKIMCNPYFLMRKIKHTCNNSVLLL